MLLNQRLYSRCKHETVQTSAVLVVSGRKIACQMVELSLGSFAVMVPEPISAALADPLAHLKFCGLSYIVRVTRQESRGDGVLVALEQVEEVLPHDSIYPTTTAGRWAARIAWVTALCLVTAAVFNMAGIHLPKL
ncbi:MAG: PilZ protein [Schlesneria sp.]|nr:PilZ protein [Schlesneria sp.]